MVPLQPAGSLEAALAGMSFTVLEGRFTLVGFEEPLRPEVWNAVERPPAAVVREQGESSPLVPEIEVEAIVGLHPSARVERRFAWIRLDVPMTLEVVGFLARVTGELAREGVPLGVVCNFSRDHLFIAERDVPKVRDCLSQSFPER